MGWIHFMARWCRKAYELTNKRMKQWKKKRKKKKRWVKLCLIFYKVEFRYHIFSIQDLKTATKCITIFMYRNYLGSLCFLRKNVIRCYDPAIRGGEGRGRNEKEKKKNKSETSKSKWQPVSPIYAMANPNWTFFMACLTRIFLMMIFTHTLHFPRTNPTFNQNPIQTRCARGFRSRRCTASWAASRPVCLSCSKYGKHVRLLSVYGKDLGTGGL